MYDVVLLVERGLSRLDAEQVTGLHSEIADTVRYCVLLPADDVSGRLHASMGSLASPDGLAPVAPLPDVDARDLVREAEAEDRAALQSTMDEVAAFGHEVTGRIVTGDPIDALTHIVGELGAAEAIILTEPHVVKEFFGLDWTTRARRHLDVPILHLLEHQPIESQDAGSGEGPSLI
jgi:hypothetical protein